MNNSNRPQDAALTHYSDASPQLANSRGSLEGELARRFEEQTGELQKVREFNAELLERLSEVRKRRSDGESDAKLRESHQQMAAMKEDFHRTFTRLTDDNWAKDLEIRRLMSLGSEAQAGYQRLQQDGARVQREIQQAQMLEMEALKESNASLTAALARLEGERNLLQTQLTELNQNFDDLERAYFDKDAEIQRARASHQQQLEDMRAQTEIELAKQQAAAIDQASANGNLEAKIALLQESLEETKAAGDNLEKDLDFERRLKEELGQKMVALEQKRGGDLSRIHELEFACSEQGKQIHHVNQLLSSFETEIEASKQELLRAGEMSAQTVREIHQQHAIEIENLRRIEAAANAKIAGLRTERLGIEKRVKEANDVAAELRTALERQKSERESEYRYLEMKATRNIAEIQSRIEIEATKTIESLQGEIDELRRGLAARDEQTNSTSNKLNEWRSSLEAREQNCLIATDWLNKSKSEIVRVSKQLAEELRHSRETHPLKDYLQLAERELKKMQLQLGTAVPGTPERAKLDSYLAQMTKEYDFLRSVLATSQQQLDERSQMVLSLLQSEVLQGDGGSRVEG